MLGFNTDYLNIGISVVLRDEFSQTADNFSNKLRGMYNMAAENVNQYNNTLQTGLDVINSWTNTVAAGMIYAIKDGADFIDTMTMVGATARTTQDELDQLTRKAQSLGYETMLESKDIASGMKYLAMAGNNAKEIQEVIGSAANLAIAGQFNLGGKGGAADLLTNILHTFSLEGEQAAKTLTDQLVMAANSANTSVEDLAVAIKYASADMVSLGQTAPEVAAAIGILGNRGIQASMAGTALSNFGRYLNRALSSGKNKFSGALAELGLSRDDIVDAQGNLLPMLDILEKLRAGVAKIYEEGGEQKRNEVLNALFGVRGFRAGLALIDNVDEYRELLNQIYNSEGYAASISQQRMDNLAGSINKLGSALENIRTSYAKSIEPVLKPILNTIAGILDGVAGFIQTPFGKVTAVLFSLGVVVARLGTWFMKYFWAYQAWMITMRTVTNKTKWSLQGLNALLRESGVILNQNAAAASRMGAGGILGKFGIGLGSKNAGGTAAQAMTGGFGWWAMNRYEKKSFMKDPSAYFMANPGTRIGGLSYTGKGWHYTSGKGGGLSTFLSGAQANALMQQKGMQRAIKNHLMGLKDNSGKLARLGASLGHFGSKVGSFAGSFLKMGLQAMLITGAITIATEAIGGVIETLQHNSDALQANTVAVNTLAGQYASAQERNAALQTRNLTEEMRMLSNTMIALRQGLDSGKLVRVVIDDNGKARVEEDPNDTGTTTGR